MPAFTEATPTLTRKFMGGIEFKVPAVFEPGHALTAPETKWVNSQVASVVANQYAGLVRRTDAAELKAHLAAGGKEKDFVSSTESWDHPAKFLEEFTDYELGVSSRGTGTASSDPLTRMVHTLATEAVKARILAKGLKVNDFMRSKVTVEGEEVSKFIQLVGAYKSQFEDDLKAQAQAQLDALQADEDDFDLGDVEAGEDQIAA